MSKAKAPNPNNREKAEKPTNNAVKAYFFDAASSTELTKAAEPAETDNIRSVKPSEFDEIRLGAGTAHFFPNANRNSVNLFEKNDLPSERDISTPTAPKNSPDREPAKKGSAEKEIKKADKSAEKSELLKAEKTSRQPSPKTLSDALSPDRNKTVEKPDRSHGDMRRLLEGNTQPLSEKAKRGDFAHALREIATESNKSTEKTTVSESKVQPSVSSSEPVKPAENGRENIKKQNDSLLSALRASDIKGNTPTAARRIFPVVRRVLMCVFLAVLIGATCFLIYSMYSRKKADAFYTELREKFYADMQDSPVTVSIGTLEKDGGSSPDTPLYSDSGDIYVSPEITTEDLHTLYTRMLPSLEALKEVNSSAFGWIKVEGTRVDYPVIRSPRGNNDYYLTHAPDLTYSDSGSIFMDYANNTDLSKNRNTCIYGHNMNDGTMFQTIMNFRNSEQFRNGLIYVYTQSGIYVYTPFAVYDAVPTDSFFKVDFESDAAFSDFLTEIRGKSLFRSTVVPKSTDKIVTLITCTNTLVDKRFVVHGVLTDIVN